MAASMVLNVLVTGICAIVPSKTDPNLTRIIVPDERMVHVNGEHAIVPEHFAFLEVPAKNFVLDDRHPDFSYHHPEDSDQSALRLVFLLRSEVLTLKTAPSNNTRTVNNTPVADLTRPQNDDQKTSIVYELEMSKVCSTCGAIRNDLFDLATNHERVAARLDILGGAESVAELKEYERVWQIDGSTVKQPLAQEVAYKLEIPAATETILLTSYPDVDVTKIGLMPVDGKPVNITLGNVPLRDLLLLDRNNPVPHKRDDHFDHLYDIYETPPHKRPLLELVPNNMVNVRSAANNCVPGEYAPQDPK